MKPLLLALALMHSPSTQRYCPGGQAVTGIPHTGQPVCTAVGALGGVPTGALYLVGAADATLSAEIVVSPLTDDIVMVANGTTWQTKVLPSCTGASGRLTYDAATNTFACATTSLDFITNPSNDKTFAMVDNHLGFTWVQPVAGPSFDGAMELSVSGAFSGDLLHLHQHSGNPPAGTDLLHAEWSDADVTGIRLSGVSGTDAITLTTNGSRVDFGAGASDYASSDGTTVTFAGPVAASGFTGALTGNASTATALSTAGSANQFWKNGNVWGQPAFSDLSGSATTGQLPTVPVTKGGTNLTTVAANQVFVGTAADTLAAATIPSCSNGTTEKLLYNNSTQTFSCGTDQTGGGGSGTMTRLTATWASSAVANTLGIIGTGSVPLTSPSISANAPFSAICHIATLRAATTNGPRYGVTASQTLTSLSVKYEIGLAGTAPTSTYNLDRTTAVTSGTCASGCTRAITASTLAQALNDDIRILGQMGANAGTVSLQMAPSAGAANTAQIGSYCIWY